MKKNREKTRALDRLKNKISKAPTEILKKNLEITQEMARLIKSELDKRGVD